MTIVYIGIAWFIGLGLASLLPLPWTAWLGGVAAAGVGGLLFRQEPWLRLVFVCAAALGLGGARYVLALPTIDPGHVAFYNEADVILTGLVVDEPVPRDTTTRLDVRVEALTLAGGATRPVTGRVLVNVERFPVIAYGTRLRLVGQLNEPPVFDTFDYREYLRRQGVHSVMLLPEVEVLAENEGSPVYQAIYAFKDRAQAVINRLIPEPQSALLSGILLGNESGLDPALQEDFRRTGMTHIIAISGFNISILSGMLVGVAAPLVGRRRAPWFALAGIAFYTIMVGADASVVRAAIMGSIYLIGARILGRPNFAYGSLFTAGILMTLWRPFSLWDVGFQLSFAATLGLMLYADRFTRWTQRRLAQRLPAPTVTWLMGPLSDAVMITLAAQLSTLPLMMYYFNQISLVSLIANPLILPAQPGLMLTGGLATLVGLLSPIVAQPIAWIAWLFLSYSITLVRLLATLPFAAVPVQINLFVVALLYLIIGGVTWLTFQPRPRRQMVLNSMRPYASQQLLIGAAVLAAILVVAWGRSQPDGHLHVVFFDVGQGDATFVQTPSGRQILINGGPSPTLLNAALGEMMPFWDRQLDLVISTHPADGYAAGLPGVLQRYRVEELVTSGFSGDTFQAYQELLRESQAQQIPQRQVVAGEVIAVEDGVRLEVLHPVSTAGDQTVALRLVYGNLSVMLAGAAGVEAEQNMATSAQALPALVQQIGRQGGRNATSTGFLNAVQPQIAIISVGSDNRSGDPQPDVLRRLADMGASVLRTDELGSIELISDGAAMWWQAR